MPKKLSKFQNYTNLILLLKFATMQHVSQNLKFSKDDLQHKTWGKFRDQFYSAFYFHYQTQFWIPWSVRANRNKAKQIEPIRMTCPRVPQKTETLALSLPKVL